MLFALDSNSPKPVYQQIMDQVKYAVAAGRLREGDRLDPIRDVAIQTRVNRNTIARAYLELEREGVIRTRAGQGSFISSEGPGLGRVRARKILADQMDDLLAQARQFQLSEAEFLEILEQRLTKVQLMRNAKG
ncbi:MAG: GntR family transcriptional regulator [Candidatus Sumerlaeota bacterium]|nr:GntR family transcriptional regulator [Candidatus Sumerlaeota bacterium]